MKSIELNHTSNKENQYLKLFRRIQYWKDLYHSFYSLCIIFMIFLISSLHLDGQARVWTDRTSYVNGETVIIHFTGMSGAKSDWIAVTKSSKPTSTYDTYKYTSGVRNGQISFEGLKPGRYEARAYFKNTYNLEARSSFEIGSAERRQTLPGNANTRIWLDQSNFRSGQAVTVYFSGMSGATSDWISIAKAGSAESSYHTYQYTGGKRQGSLVFQNLKDGNYEARAYFNNNYTLVTKTNFTIGGSQSPTLPPDNPFVQLPPPNSQSNNGNTSQNGSSAIETGIALGQYDHPNKLGLDDPSKIGQAYCYTCGKDNGWHSVRGDVIYTPDSYICSAAIHAGKISTSGGKVCIRITPPEKKWGKGKRNGITSYSTGTPHKTGFIFVNPSNSNGQGNQTNNSNPNGNPSSSNYNPNEWRIDKGTYTINGQTIYASPHIDGQTSYFISPTSFHGNWVGLKWIRFELKSSGGSYYLPQSRGADGDVVLRNGNMKATYQFDRNHNGPFARYDVPIMSTRWRLSGGARTLNDVLRNVTEFKIRAEFGIGEDYTTIRNIHLK